MTFGYLLWCFTDAQGWYELADIVDGYIFCFYLLALALVIAGIVIDFNTGGAWRLGTGVLICFAIWMAGLIIPVLRSGSNPTQFTCSDMQRQLAVNVMVYAMDHGGHFPATWQDIDDSSSGLKKNGHYFCPLTIEPFHQLGGYGLNGQLMGRLEKDITDPAHVFLIADSVQPDSILQSTRDIATRRHSYRSGRGFVISHLDGRVEHVPEGVTLNWK